uniref:Uncharacterized protein n=1 Tax=Rhizophora mucronata TaxID=61149 RepID=A0A2P2Q9B2_RHIMU
MNCLLFLSCSSPIPSFEMYTITPHPTHFIGILYM